MKLIRLWTLILFPTGVMMAQTDLRIWYRQPADASIPDRRKGWGNDPEWLKALPLGNGSLGAMVYGDVTRERIQLNEKSLWSGSPADNDNPLAYGALAEIRSLLFDGKYKEASALTLKTQVCKGAGSGHGNGANAPFGCYQTLGNLWIDMERTSRWKNYERSLDLMRGIATVKYLQEGINFERDVFISYPDRAMVVRIRADRKGALKFRVRLDRPERFRNSRQGNDLLMTGVLDDGNGGEGMRYAARLRVRATGGRVTMTDSSIRVEGADEAVLGDETVAGHVGSEFRQGDLGEVVLPRPF